MVGKRTPRSNRGRLAAKWFLIGFLVRAALAIVITLLMARNSRQACCIWLIFQLSRAWIWSKGSLVGHGQTAFGKSSLLRAFEYLGSFLWDSFYARCLYR